MPNFIKHKVREPAILTTSYVSGKIVRSTSQDNQLIIRINFTKGSLTSGELKVEASSRLLYTILYDGQTANFKVGEIITGGTNGATFKIIKDTDSGAAGTLIAEPISGGNLADNEAITGSNGGAAVVNGAVNLSDETKIDDESWERIQNESLSGGTTTISDQEFTWTTDTNKRIALAAMDPYFRISVKGTGTVTGSLMGVRAETGLI